MSHDSTNPVNKGDLTARLQRHAASSIALRLSHFHVRIHSQSLHPPTYVSCLSRSVTQQHYTVKSQSVLERHLKIFCPFGKMSLIQVAVELFIYGSTLCKEKGDFVDPTGSSRWTRHSLQHDRKTAIKENTKFFSAPFSASGSCFVHNSLCREWCNCG